MSVHEPSGTSIQIERLRFFPTCFVNDAMEQTYKPCTFLIADMSALCLHTFAKSGFIFSVKNMNIF